ncbi:hypothetical protein L596_021805 [Steinernema carpocapsae]|uniref:Uncharacterized protein n=1 Tax=Steinernema carpocapsae TaxID=34508 RepID=A0A4V6A030_STECR|nr:hypothetical protein L596_021805 [Steinernema carpocapsae]
MRHLSNVLMSFNSVNSSLFIPTCRSPQCRCRCGIRILRFCQPETFAKLQLARSIDRRCFFLAADSTDGNDILTGGSNSALRPFQKKTHETLTHLLMHPF